MKIILTALRQEARPLIEALGLKQDRASRKIPVYSGDDFLLVISGIGKLYAGIATTHAVHLAGNTENCRLVNVGMCGAVHDQIALGEAVLVHKIWDHGSGREFFPDMLLKTPLQEASLGTFDDPVTSAHRSLLSCDIVDMEASGVFQAAHLFLSPHQMQFLKVVTDYLEFSSEDYTQMKRYYEESLEQWIGVLKMDNGFSKTNPILTEEHEELLEEVVARMRLTKTQSHQLRDAVMRYLVRRGADLSILKPIISEDPLSKATRNELLERIFEVLHR